MMFQQLNWFRIGLRTFKTALAVTLALLLVLWRGSPDPAFAAIGAIAAMSRTVADSARACMIQIGAVTIGALLAAVFLNFLPIAPYLLAGLGVLFLLAFCHVLHLENTAPLACIVFIVICMTNPSKHDLWWYSYNRLIDTVIGLLTALIINISIKPYHNRNMILRMLSSLRRSVMLEFLPAVLLYRYPNIAPLQRRLARLSEELNIFERQPVRRLLNRSAYLHAHRQEADWLHGCEQLVYRMAEELTALSHNDEEFLPNRRLQERLQLYGFHFPESQLAAGCSSAVMEYHLMRLLNACACLDDLLVLAGEIELRRSQDAGPSAFSTQ